MARFGVYAEFGITFKSEFNGTTGWRLMCQAIIKDCKENYNWAVAYDTWGKQKLQSHTSTMPDQSLSKAYRDQKYSYRLQTGLKMET